MIRSITLISVSLASTVAFADVNSALQDYLSLGRSVESQLEILKGNAGSCGFVGTFVAGRMQRSININREQMNNVTASVRSNNRAGVEQTLQAAEEGNDELRSNLSMVRNGLSTDNPACRKAKTAFERLVSLSLAQPSKLKKIISEM